MGVTGLHNGGSPCGEVRMPYALVYWLAYPAKPTTTAINIKAIAQESFRQFVLKNKCENLYFCFCFAFTAKPLN